MYELFVYNMWRSYIRTPCLTQILGFSRFPADYPCPIVPISDIPAWKHNLILRGQGLDNDDDDDNDDVKLKGMGGTA